MTPPKLTPAQRAKAVQLVRDGYPIADIARRYQVYPSVVQVLVNADRAARAGAEPGREGVSRGVPATTPAGEGQNAKKGALA